MEHIIKFLGDNSEWLFSGAGIVVIGALVKLFYNRGEKNDQSGVQNISNNPNNNISINVGNIKNADIPQNPLLSNSLNSTTSVKILFIDDNHTDFRMVSILKKSGYPLTKSVKDITDLNDPKINESDIIFVDINGVGLTLFNDQGLGLASALKTRYPDKKIVLYSAESNGDRFHKALREVDGCLYKDAEPYQFISKIEELTNGKKEVF